MMSESKSQDVKKNPHLSKAVELLEVGKQLYASFLAGKGWDAVLSKPKEGTSLYRKYRNEVSPVPCYLVETTIDKPKNKVLECIWGDDSGEGFDEKMAKENDSKVRDWRIVEKDISWKIISQHNDMAWPIWPRHFCFAQTRFDQDDTTYLVAHSVDHSSAKTDTKNYVEAKMCLSVYGFKDNGDKTTSVWRVAQVDPCGNVPVFLINWYAGNLVDMFNRWKK